MKLTFLFFLFLFESQGCNFCKSNDNSWSYDSILAKCLFSSKCDEGCYQCNSLFNSDCSSILSIPACISNSVILTKQTCLSSYKSSGSGKRIQHIPKKSLCYWYIDIREFSTSENSIKISFKKPITVLLTQVHDLVFIYAFNLPKTDSFPKLSYYKGILSLINLKEQTILGNYFVVGYWNEVDQNSTFEFSWKTKGSGKAFDFLIVQILVPCFSVLCCLGTALSCYKKKKHRVNHYRDLSRSHPDNYTVFESHYPLKYCLEKIANPCAICYEEYFLFRFKVGDEIREISCSHLFHAICLDEWVDSRPAHYCCPMCKKDLFNLPK